MFKVKDFVKLTFFTIIFIVFIKGRQAILPIQTLESYPCPNHHLQRYQLVGLKHMIIIDRYIES